MKMRNHDHIKGEKGENLIISQDKKLHNSAKSWSFFKKLGSFELLMVWAARNWSYMLNLTHSRPFYEQITLCASYQARGCISLFSFCLGDSLFLGDLPNSESASFPGNFHILYHQCCCSHHGKWFYYLSVVQVGGIIKFKHTIILALTYLDITL